MSAQWCRHPLLVNKRIASHWKFGLQCAPGILQKHYSASARLAVANSRDQDLLHRSIVPTYFFQKSLPRLPIPSLEDTCRRYLECVSQILTPEEYAATEKIVKKFPQEGLGCHYELEVLNEINSHTSYISGPWFDMYLKSRLPVVLNFNPFMNFTDDPRPEYQDQLLRATNMIVSSLRFMKTLKEAALEPDVYHLNPKQSDNPNFWKFVRRLPERYAFYGAAWYKAYPLDMSQYGRLFNSTRIPKFERDEFLTDISAKHILVMRNGNFYVFNVLDENGMIIKPDEILSHLSYIQKDQRPPTQTPLGALTTLNRDKWATVRQQLVNSGNETNLRLIDTAVFCLCLDDTTPADPNAVTRQFLHGDGVNRWFDKSFQLIMTPDGKAGVNFEHAWGDGVAVVRYFNEVYKDSTKNSALTPSTPPANVNSADVVKCLEFNIDPHVKEDIENAKKSFDKTVASLDLHFLEYQKFTKKYVKSQSFSPDALMQLIIQMAYYKQYGKTVATYESCSTAVFKHGRTETIRPATRATKQLCKMFIDKGSKHSVAELRQSLEQCSKLHTKLTKEAAMGQGFDRHLFGLLEMGKTRARYIPDLFKDPAYEKINHNILSTSTISSPAVLIGGFAPVVPDGYGVGYSIEDGRIGFNVTSYPPATNVREFIDCVEQCLDDVYEVFEGRPPKK